MNEEIKRSYGTDISVEDEAYVKNDRGNVCDKVKKDDSYNFMGNTKTEKYKKIT